MKCFLTPDGFYYEANAALGSNDLEVPVRPSGHYRFDLSLHDWVPHRAHVGDVELHHTPHQQMSTRHHQSGAADMSEIDMLGSMRITMKDMIQITFAAISLVSIYYALKQDIQGIHFELNALREQVVAVQRQMAEHDGSETAHYRQMQAISKHLREIENHIGYGRATLVPGAGN